MNKLILFFLVLVIFACSSKQESTYPQKQDITESVYASAEVIPSESYTPQTNRAGIIQEVFVEEGSLVKRNEIIAMVSFAEFDNRLVDATLNLKQAKENYKGNNNLLENVQLEIETLKKQVALDSIQFFRQERLWKQDIGSELDKDNAKIKWETSQNRLATLQKQYQQQKQNLKNAYERALNNVESQQSILDDFIIRSKMDGKVYALYKEAGEMISMQEPFAEIGSADSFKIKMDIDEVDITKLELGDTILLALDAYPDTVYSALLNKVYPKKETSTQTFKVEGTFIQKPAKLYHGLSGEANIVIGRKSGVITIPPDYLNNGKVTTKEGEIEVQVGLRNMQFVEIISGLDVETKILKEE